MHAQTRDTRSMGRVENDDVGYPFAVRVSRAQCARHAGGVRDENGFSFNAPRDVADRFGKKPVIRRILEVDEESRQQGAVTECLEP